MVRLCPCLLSVGAPSRCVWEDLCGAQAAASGSSASTLNFFLNGAAVSVENPDPTVLLVDYIRDVAQLKGTKVGCNEGGCGACTVVLSRRDAATGTPLPFLHVVYPAVGSSSGALWEQ